MALGHAATLAFGFLQGMQGVVQAALKEGSRSGYRFVKAFSE
jgi:hypothetical protein